MQFLYGLPMVILEALGETPALLMSRSSWSVSSPASSRSPSKLSANNIIFLKPENTNETGPPLDAVHQNCMHMLKIFFSLKKI